GLIHPSQIEPVHKVFSPTKEEIEYARKVVDALREAEEKGLGVIALGRKMIDRPVAERAKRILKLAEELGLLEVNDD
ncbi:citrate lyase ACP, partial [bacterium]